MYTTKYGFNRFTLCASCASVCTAQHKRENIKYSNIVEVTIRQIRYTS